MLKGLKINKRYKKLIATPFSFVILIVALFFLLSLKKNIEPNVILITFDALRADHIGCYGYKKETTPFLDLFSKNGFTFTNVIAQSASTVPSIASLFTSKYPYSDCVIDSSYSLGNNNITIVEFLKKKGYETYGIVGHYYVAKKFGFFRGFNYFNDNFYAFRNADEMQRLAIELLKKIKKNKKFFLWLHFHEPHSPYRSLAQYRKIFSETFSGQDTEKIYTIYGNKLLLSNKQIHELIIAYDANIRFMDDNLRILFKFLKKHDLIRKSIIIITADHGESLGEHNIFDHNELYYGIIHVPLIIKAPYSKGGVISYPVSLIDIFPTVLDLLGYKEEALKLNLRGRNLFLNRKIDEIQFSEYPNKKSIIKDNFRIFLNESNFGLYNIKDDPVESNNLVSIEKEKFEFLKKGLDNFIKKKEPCTEKPRVILNEEDKEKLKSLGYVQ